jgi:hypothetical protein
VLQYPSRGAVAIGYTLHQCAEAVFHVGIGHGSRWRCKYGRHGQSTQALVAPFAQQVFVGSVGKGKRLGSHLVGDYIIESHGIGLHGSYLHWREAERGTVATNFTGKVFELNVKGNIVFFNK